MAEHVNSYDPKAPIPAIGSRWVWEIDRPQARCLIEVVEVKWNGEEWWVATRSLLADLVYPGGGGLHWNDVGRFHEAVTGVGRAAYGAWMSWSEDRRTHYVKENHG
jgi:hypothetical protein